MKKGLALLLVLVLIVGLAACGGGGGSAEDQVFELRFSTTVSEATAWTQAAQQIADEMYARTNGNVIITVYPNEVLAGGNQAAAAEMVMDGLVDLDARSNIIFTVLNESFGVATLPFMYESPEQAREVLLGPAGDHYRQLLADSGLTLLGFGESGMRQLTSNIPIHTAEDLQGLRIRVPGMQLLMAAFEQMGANPISMIFAEVFMALQQGAIDGQENPLDVIYGNLIYEVQDYLILWNYAYDVLFFTINTEVFESLPAAYQEILLEVGAAATEWQVEQNRLRTAEQLAYFETQGMTVIVPTAEAMESFRQVGEYMRELFGAPDRFGQDVIDLFTP